MEIIGHVEFEGGGIVIGTDDVVVEEYDVGVISMRWAPVMEWW